LPRALLLLGLAVTGPLALVAASAGLGAEPPEAAEQPLLTLTPGEDYAAAERLGWARGFRALDEGAFALDLRGPAGGTVTIDALAVATKGPGLASWALEAAEVGGLPPGAFVLRAWSGPVAPASDEAPGVCAVLDLGTGQAQGRCEAPLTRLQAVLALPAGTSPSRASFRPASLVLA
jgi:hypothetical protein